jgi:hypothetical protein
MRKPLVFMFPGQSSRDPGMLDRIVALRPANRDVLAEASETLSYDLRAATAFATNRDVQLAVFVANHMLLQTLDAAGITAELSLGLSLGEYNHLVHIGCLPFADAFVWSPRAAPRTTTGPMARCGRCFRSGPIVGVHCREPSCPARSSAAWLRDSSDLSVSTLR